MIEIKLNKKKTIKEMLVTQYGAQDRKTCENPQMPNQQQVGQTNKKKINWMQHNKATQHLLRIGIMN